MKSIIYKFYNRGNNLSLIKYVKVLRNKDVLIVKMKYNLISLMLMGKSNI